MADPFTSDAKLIMSLHWFAQHNGAKQHLVWTAINSAGTGAVLRALNCSNYPSGNPWATLEDESYNLWDGSDLERQIVQEPWQGEQSVVWGGNLYLCNGYDPVIVYDGEKTNNAGYSSAPARPTASQWDPRLTVSASFPDVGLGEVGLGIEEDNPSGVADEHEYAVGVYAYRMSWVNERGQESPISGPSGVVKVNVNPWYDEVTGESDTRRSGTHVELSQGPPGTVARRLYRTKNLIATSGIYGLGNIFNVNPEGQNYYFHSEIRDNSTTGLDDHKPDMSLGSLLDINAYGAIPAGVKYMATFKNTMFYAGMTSNQIRFSRPLLPEVTPEDNSMDIGASSHGPITGLYSTKNALVVFKPRAIYLVKGDPATGFYAQTLTEDYGCVAQGSIREIPGVGLAFLSHDSINVLEGALENTGTETRIVSISTPIYKYVEKINFSAALNVRSAVYHKDKEFWLAVPTVGSMENNLVLVFHYETLAWSIRDGFPIKCMVETNDHRGYLLFGSHSTSAYGIHYYSRGVKTKGAATVTPKWESVHHPLMSEYNVVKPLYVDAYAVAYSDNDLRMDFRVNRSVHDARTNPSGRPQQEPGDSLAVYGTAAWGSSTRWGFFRPIVLRFGTGVTDKGRVREMQVAFSAEGTRMQLVGYAIEIHESEHSNQTPIDTSIAARR